ncbi:MAG: hypothetical protein ABFD07_17510 [Methanobacterium sp.]
MVTDIQFDTQYISGTLDPEATLGKGTIIEYVVLTTLGDCVKENFNYPYNLTSASLGEINVKSSSKHHSRNGKIWSFSKKPNSYIPEHYICVGLDEEFKKIIRVWIIPGDARVIGTHGINIIDKDVWLNKFRKYEVNPSPYNATFQTLDITTFPEFCNIDVQDLTLYKSIANDILNMFMIADIEAKYGEGSYEEYLKWVDEKGLKKYFNLKGGVIGIYPHENFREVDLDNYPVFNYTGKYVGAMYYGDVFDDYYDPAEHDMQPYISRCRHVKNCIKKLAQKHNRITLEQIRRESSVDRFTNIINDLKRRGIIVEVEDNEYIVP